MSIGIGEKISGLASDATTSVTDFASSAFDSVAGLFDLNDQPKPTEPVPKPVPLKPLSKSDFEINPTLEKVLIDPFEALELKKLSKADLGIDKVVDYLSSIIPADLMDAVKGAPGLATTLLEKTKSLERFVSDVANKLPQNISLGEVLRGSSIMDIYNNIDDFKSTVSELGMRIENMPAKFTSDSLRFMSNMKTAFDTTRYQKMFSNLTSMDSFTGSRTYRYNPIAVTSVTLANVNASALNTASTSSFFVTSGVESGKDIINIVRTASPSEFASVCAGLKTIGQNRSIVLCNAIKQYGPAILKIVINNIFNKFKNDTTISNDITLLSALTLQHGEAITSDIYSNTANTFLLDICIFVSSYGLVNLQPIVTSLDTYGEHDTNTHFIDVNDLIVTFTTPILLAVLEEIKTLGVTEYLTQYPTTPYGDIIAIVSLTTVDYVISYVNTLMTLTLSEVAAIISTIGNLPVGIIDNILTVAAVSVDDPQTLLLLLKRITNEQYLTYTTYKGQYGVSLLDALITSINGMGLQNALNFITNVNTIGVESVKTNMISMIALSPESVKSIAAHISYNNPLIQLQKINPTGPFLHYSVKVAADLCSKAGKALMVESLIKGYKGTIVYSERYGYVMNILQNYKPDDDDTVLGPKLAAKYFVSALFAICPTWDIVDSKTPDIINMVPFIKANPAALKLLVEDERTMVSALLQKNEYYKI